MERRASLIFSLLPPLLIGIALISWGIGIYGYRQTHALEAHGVHARGRVVGFNHQPASPLYRPVITFRTENGFNVEFVGQGASSSPGFFKGEPVDVVYLRDNPVGARVNTFFEMWGACLFTLVFGSLFGIIGLALIVAPRVMQRRAA